MRSAPGQKRVVGVMMLRACGCSIEVMHRGERRGFSGALKTRSCAEVRRVSVDVELSAV